MQSLRHLATAAACAALLAASSAVNAEHWAVIVAGSRGYDNYRHQADACHAYHVVRRHGIPAENVILMMYDDVASHHDNPFPGQLFNKPANSSDAPAVDVYRGCEVEYRGDDVTPEMFVNVLLGNASATNGKRVLESTASDRVFVNFVDHGARGLVVFPQGQELSTKTLNRALQHMHAAGKYKELVFYMEACESGSMFSNRALRKINAFATTAANGIESSWGTYCPPLDVVHGKELGTCLGDLYSVNWMEDSDLTDLSDESVREQFQRVKRATNRSHVHQFGSTAIPREIVGNFQSNYDKGDGDSDGVGHPPAVTTRVGSKVSASASAQTARGDTALKASSAVNAHDVDLVLAFYRYLRASPGAARRALADSLVERIHARERDDALFEHIQALYAARTNGPLRVQSEPQNDECRERAFASFEARCSGVSGRHRGDADIGRGFTSYSLKYAGVLSDLCESPLSAPQIDALLQEACGSGVKTTATGVTQATQTAPVEHDEDDEHEHDADRDARVVFDPELSLLG